MKDLIEKIINWLFYTIILILIGSLLYQLKDLGNGLGKGIFITYCFFATYISWIIWLYVDDSED